MILLSISILLTVPVLLINGLEKDSISTVSNHIDNDENENMIIDASKFSRISSNKLIEIMGEPDIKEDMYPVTYYVYDKEKFEFIIINNTVVKLTYQGAAVTDKSKDNLFSLFGISPGPNLTQVYDDLLGVSYQMVNEEIADYSITFLEKTTFFKITYDSGFSF
ncbi:hypothetical protein FHR92_003531 [Fontibacillus solani]|uniref:Uncharacterized protein n=1 Tax=Fontibacillus solani TaxID=1572857 RepID=A0A7W3XSY7_9BACL|nr:hypothetical protein [Fontibacillus solani]MBA9087051.1 hypothetical protein [Fontibacillus solani]